MQLKYLITSNTSSTLQKYILYECVQCASYAKINSKPNTQLFITFIRPLWLNTVIGSDQKHRQWGHKPKNYGKLKEFSDNSRGHQASRSLCRSQNLWTLFVILKTNTRKPHKTEANLLLYVVAWQFKVQNDRKICCSSGSHLECIQMFDLWVIWMKFHSYCENQSPIICE